MSETPRQRDPLFTMETLPGIARRLEWYFLAWTGSAILLLTATRALWNAGSGGNAGSFWNAGVFFAGDIHFPQVPLFAGLVHCPQQADAFFYWVILFALMIAIGARLLAVLGHHSNWLMARSLIATRLLSGKFSAAFKAKTLDRTTGWVLLLFAVGLLGAVALNQHRLQPWAYQFGLLAVFFSPLWLIGSVKAGVAFCQSPRMEPATSIEHTGSDVAVEPSPDFDRASQKSLIDNRSEIDPATMLVFAWCRWLAISIYAYSAISKFDYTFFHTLGPSFLDTLLQILQIPPAIVPAALRWYLIALFPIGELWVGLGLASGYRPRLFVSLAIGLHSSLLLILGPIGQQHETGVLLWNIFFILQAILLFWPIRKCVTPPSVALRMTSPRATISEFRAAWFIPGMIFWVAMVLPLAEPIGHCDHWLAWELYAPRSSRVRIYVQSDAVSQVPEYLQPFVSDNVSPSDDPFGFWTEIRLDRWSTDELRAPLYPEDRFHLGVARALCDLPALQGKWRIDWSGAADRMTGKRETKTLHSSRECEQFAARFYFNTIPREP